MIFRWIVSKIYFMFIRIRQFIYSKGIKKRYESRLPVASIGSIEFGGTGKTPMAYYIIEYLQKMGFTPILLSRGYGRMKSEQVIARGRIKNGSHKDFGDEPYMINQKTACDMIIHKDRAASAKIAETMNIEKPVLVLDDGFQYMKLIADIDIILLTGGTSIKERKMFPFKDKEGYSMTFRDSPNRLKEADFIFMKDERIDDIDDFSDAAKYIFSYRVNNDAAFDKVVLLSAIARNERFYETASQFDCEIIEHFKFKDHHNYEPGELSSIIAFASGHNCDAILTTEKDYYRIPTEFLTKFKFIPIRIVIEIENENDFIDKFTKKLEGNLEILF
ncbi:MAG: tetraacyldisaccharide 4'-kinase [Candidatus Zixiibacteriota bacterium]